METLPGPATDAHQTPPNPIEVRSVPAAPDAPDDESFPRAVAGEDYDRYARVR